MDDHHLLLRVDYSDPPDLIEVQTQVAFEGWTAQAAAYVSPKGFAASCQRLFAWVNDPAGSIVIEEGADIGHGSVRLEFYEVDRAGHICCAVQLTQGGRQRGARPAETWRFALEIPTELGLVEQFARACLIICTRFEGKAHL